MNVRFASVAAALTLSVADLAAPALAKSYSTPVGVERQVRVADAFVADTLRSHRFTSSAKAGNAEQTALAVPQFGTTSGGPAY